MKRDTCHVTKEGVDDAEVKTETTYVREEMRRLSSRKEKERYPINKIQDPFLWHLAKTNIFEQDGNSAQTGVNVSSLCFRKQSTFLTRKLTSLQGKRFLLLLFRSFYDQSFPKTFLFRLWIFNRFWCGRVYWISLILSWGLQHFSSSNFKKNKLKKVIYDKLRWCHRKMWCFLKPFKTSWISVNSEVPRTKNTCFKKPNYHV